MILDDSNTSLVVVGHKGPGTTSSGATSATAYSPYIAKFTISGATTGWVPAYQADFSTSDSTATGHRAVAVVKVGDYYYSAYTHIGTGGVRIAKFATSDLAPARPEIPITPTSNFYFSPLLTCPVPPATTPTATVTAMATDGSSVWITGTCLTTSMNYQTPGIPYILKLTPGTPDTLINATADFSLETASSYLLSDIIYYQNQNQKKLILVGQKKTDTTEEGWILAKDISTDTGTVQTFLPSNCKGSCFYTLGGINQGVPSYGYVAAVNKMGFFVYQSVLINPTLPYLDLNAGSFVTLPFFIRYGLPVDTSTSSPELINQKRVNSCSVDWPPTFDAATRVTPKVTFTYDDETKTGEGEVGLANINCKFTDDIGVKTDSSGLLT
ncbi:MAG: hypothetical protein HQ462_07415, partial [Deltaproteobacteria bacterium]|nr:hypothetical protein [Deltaproteobacteria bacterium]